MSAVRGPDNGVMDIWMDADGLLESTLVRLMSSNEIGLEKILRKFLYTKLEGMVHGVVVHITAFRFLYSLKELALGPIE